MPLVEILVPSHPATNVPAFLAKLWKMVDNPDTGGLFFTSMDIHIITPENLK